MYKEEDCEYACVLFTDLDIFQPKWQVIAEFLYFLLLFVVETVFKIEIRVLYFSIFIFYTIIISDTDSSTNFSM